MSRPDKERLMIMNFEEIAENLNKIRKHLSTPEELVPPAKEKIKSVDEEVADELANPPYSDQTEDAQFITKCYKYLRKLGYTDSQYQFSEQFLNKNKYYFGMILCEHRKPSIDCVHNLIRNISDLNDGVTKRLYLDRLYQEGQSILTKRLLKYL